MFIYLFFHKTFLSSQDGHGTVVDIECQTHTALRDLIGFSGSSLQRKGKCGHLFIITELLETLRQGEAKCHSLG